MSPSTISSKTRKLKESVVSAVFDSLIKECQNAIKQTGGNPDDYSIRAYPFSIERKDKKPVCRKILQAIQSKLKN
jgi:hypothetical protein